MKNNNGKGGNDAVGWIEITIKSGDKQTVESVGSNHAATEWVDIDSGAKKIVALQVRSTSLILHIQLWIYMLTLDYRERAFKSTERNERTTSP
jgi:hypothetical protein